MYSYRSNLFQTPGIRVSKEIETDIDLQAPLHPLTKDICIFTEKNSIKNSIKNLVLTKRHDRLFNRNQSSTVGDILFKSQLDVFNIYNFEKNISDLLNTHEPRITDAKCTITQVDDNSINIRVIFTIIGSQELVDYTFYLNRLR